jgi:site-specific DNA-methyltransferase (adenine-specific)
VKPYYERDGIVIYHADCREILPQLEPVDLVLTDPPYGIGLAANPFRQRFEAAEWDNSPVDADTLRMAVGCGTDAIVWGGNYFGLPAHQRFLVWDKVQPEDFSSAMCEQAWTTLGGPAKLFRRHVVSYEKWHPTQKPVELMRWCLEFAPEARTILDPFMGSGTTLRAAKDLGRKAIGIEIEERYCEIAAKRLSQSVLPMYDGWADNGWLVKGGYLLEEPA